jgi:DNA invertase Pin-like site-specific DNA recombinase
MKERSLPSPARGRRDTELLALDQQPLISGRCADPRVGEFSGTAFAKQEPLPGQPAETSRESKARALGYVSVPADANGRAAAEVSAQTAAIERACAERGLELVSVVRDSESAPGADLERPALRHVLEQIALGEASCMVVGGLECLGGSASAVGTLVSWFEADGRRLVAADLDLDTETEMGKLAARALGAAGKLESRKLAERTRRGLAAARAKGVTAGRPSVADQPDLRERIAMMRAEGKTLQAIADDLNAEGVPTLRGGTHWRPSSVQAAAGYKRPGRVRGVQDLPGWNGLRPTGT